MSNITGVEVFFANCNAFKQASLDGELASAVPEIKSAFAFLM